MAVRSQEEFVHLRKPVWNELEAILASGKELHKLAPNTISRAVGLYRVLCGDLTDCRSASYSNDLLAYLDGLAARAHNSLYGARPYRLPAVWRMVAHEFPQTLRKRWAFFFLAFALFGIPLLVGVFGVLAEPSLAEKIMPPAQLAMMAEMYSEGFDGRAESTDAAMAGFYVHNNIGIAFRCFATGILAGLGSLFFLIYNGLMIGVTTGWVMHSGGGANILTFMCGHGPFELTAIVISGGAGLQMGYALVKTDGRTRLGSLRAQAPELARLILGAGVMLAIAALVEGFWSPSGLPPVVKWIASGVFSTFVVFWLAFGGRRQADGEDSAAARDRDKPDEPRVSKPTPPGASGTFPAPSQSMVGRVGDLRAGRA